MRAKNAKKTKILKNVRPTSGKVLLALFNILNASGHIEGVRFLDLFAGTGGVSAAALAAGAEAVTAVETDREMFLLMSQRLRESAGERQVRCVRGDVRRVVPKLARGGGGEHAPFGVVFADPPYHMGWGLELPPLIEKNDALLLAGGVFVFERSIRETVAEIAIPRDDRSYGETVLSFYWKDR